VCWCRRFMAVVCGRGVTAPPPSEVRGWGRRGASTLCRAIQARQRHAAGTLSRRCIATLWQMRHPPPLPRQAAPASCSGGRIPCRVGQGLRGEGGSAPTYPLQCTRLGRERRRAGVACYGVQSPFGVSHRARRPSRTSPASPTICSRQTDVRRDRSEGEGAACAGADDGAAQGADDQGARLGGPVSRHFHPARHPRPRPRTRGANEPLWPGHPPARQPRLAASMLNE
jgi:hypothetical protein